MATKRYKTNIGTPKARRGRKTRNRARNAAEKKMALEGIAHKLHPGFGLPKFKKETST